MVYEQYWAKRRRLRHCFDPTTHQRRLADTLGLSKQAKLRLEWFLWRQATGATVATTCRRFGITPKTYHKWVKRYDTANLRTLEDQSKAPHNRRQKEYVPLQYERVVALRRQFLRYGKVKLLDRYHQYYPDDRRLSLWHVQCIIQASGLYYRPAKHQRTQVKRLRAEKKKRLTELTIKRRTGFLFRLDTMIKYWAGTKRTIFTAIDHHAKLAFARMYPTKHTRNAQDFLYRLCYLTDGKIERLGHDNGSEFKGSFALTAKELGIPQYWSRPRTPKDNAVCERFNRTLQEEFIATGKMTANCEVFNRQLTEWLIEYNFRRPHASLGYITPINFIYRHSRLLPMYPSST
ncbi:MAG: integrase core domain-containing protein [Patescibacteria group bacterium]